MKKFILFIVCAALAVPAFAGSISRGGGSFSGSRSFSSPARSMGMSRPSVAPSYTAPSRPSTTPNYAPPSPTVSHTAPSYSAPQSGSPFMSSLGGSFLGSWIGSSMGSHNNGTTVVNAGGGGVAPTVAAPGYVTGGTVVAAAPSVSPVGFLWQLLGIIVLLAIIAGVLWGIVAVVRSFRREKMMDAPATLPFSPVSHFLEVQRAFAAKDVPALRALLGPDLIDQVLADLPEESTAPQLAGISYTVAGISSGVISIHFQAEDRMDGSRLDETWHFSRIGGVWVLNGIDQ